MRILALHLTKPSASEAKVLAALLRSLDSDIELLLLTNLCGADDTASYFAELSTANERICVKPLDVMLPIDPQLPRHIARRAITRVEHRLCYGKVLRAAREYRPDAIYTSQQAFDCKLGEFIAAKLEVPHIVHLHYNVGPWLKGHVLRTLRSCDLVICVSRFVAEQARKLGVDAERTYLLHNALDFNDSKKCGAVEKKVSDGTITIGQVGRMSHEKGFLDTLIAFAAVNRVLPNTRLLLVGDGPQRKHLECFVDENNLGGVVTFAGWRDNVSSTLAEMDIFTFTSRNEPFGMALLEACAAGLPCIAYQEGGVPEILIDRESGILVPPGDLKALASAMSELCSQPDRRKSLSQAARKRVHSHFAPAPAAHCFSQQLRAVAAAGQRGRPTKSSSAASRG